MENTKVKKTKVEIEQIILSAKKAKDQGVSYIQYCLENNLNYETFNYWMYKRAKQPEHQAYGFSMIQKHAVSSCGAITIEYKGARILVTDEGQLKAVLSALN